MITETKIKALGEWSPTPRSKRQNTYKSRNESLRFYKQQCLTLRKVIKKLKGDAYIEAKDTLALIIRQAQKIIRKKIKSHYFEPTDEIPKTDEHLIPQNQLTDAFLSNKLTFEEMLSMPIVKLGPTSNRLLEKAGLQNINEDWVYPFKRYKIAGIEDNIKLPNGVPVKFDNFTLMKHFQINNILKL